MVKKNPLNDINECNVMELLQQMLGTASQGQSQAPGTGNTPSPGYNYNGYGYNGYNGLNGYPCDSNGYLNGYGYGK